LRAYSFQKLPWPSLTPLIIHVAAWHISWTSVSLRRSRWEKKEAVFTVLEKETQ
jgi:hypothetical protein